MNLQYRPCSEGRTRDVHSSSLLIDVYALFSDVSLRRRTSMTGWEIPGPFLSRAMLICSIIWLGKRMLRSLLFCGFCSSLTWGCRIQCRWFVLSEVVFTLSWCRSINTIPARRNWLFDVVWWPPRTLWYVDDNHYHFAVLFGEKRYQKHRRE